MIKVTELNALCTQIVAAIPAIKKHILVADENHAVNRLKEVADICLVAVIPSADRDGEVNSTYDRNATWLFILEKDDAGQSEATELEQYQRTQNVILELRDWIDGKAEGGCSELHRYEVKGTKIDPEYRQFGGYNGWSMSLVF